MSTEFENLLVFHCSPTLMRLKASNLICCPKGKFEDLPGILESYNLWMNPLDIFLKPLWETEKRLMVLVYRKTALRQRLEESAVMDFLEAFGYPRTLDVETALRQLQKNIGISGEFPHEIGIFLDYPLEDVVGFIRNNGKNCKACGCWKVYGDVEKNLRLFETYSRCREHLFRQLTRGRTVQELLLAV